jgi:hypothetical protein
MRASVPGIRAVSARAASVASKTINSKGEFRRKGDLASVSEPSVALNVISEPNVMVESTKESHDKKKDKSWNDMSHLSLKRFRDDDPTLTPGAKRNRSRFNYLAIAELDPSGRAICKLCGERIQPKGTLRMGLMLECHKGYRNLCTLHASSCFWQHPETKKLTSLDEVYIQPNVVEANDKEMIARKLEEMIQEKSNVFADRT